MASNKPRGNMPQSLRAKQFAPFAALKGLDEALAEKERIRVEKRLLSEERLSELNDKLMGLTVGQIVTVVHYDPIEREYIQLTGMVAKIDAQNRILRIVSESIKFDNLFEIITSDIGVISVKS